MKTWKSKQAFDKSMFETIEPMKEQAYKEQAFNVKEAYKGYLQYGKEEAARVKEEFGDQAATRIMDAWKKEVPAFKTLPSDREGLIDAVRGIKGRELVSKAYDDSLKEVVARAGNKLIPVPLDVAEGLNLAVIPMSLGMGRVSASEAAQAIVGQSMSRATSRRA
jgi:phage/plasmid-associated DNA primase